jgi:hypothetical protein
VEAERVCWGAGAGLEGAIGRDGRLPPPDLD